MDRDSIKLRITNEVFDSYSKSSEFNGISFQSLKSLIKISEDDLKDNLKELLKQGQLTFTFSSVFLNPYIKAFRDPSIEKQLELFETESVEGICIYPSPHYLKQVSNDNYLENVPYTKRLFMGEPQLEPVYFELSVLERFFNDPRYLIHNDDYSGNIYVKDEFSESMPEKDKINLQTFGLAYDKNFERKIIVYLRYLNKLSPEQQQYWKGYEYAGQCKQNVDYLKNTLGHWADNVSIFIAFVEELHQINNMSLKMGKPELFKHDYKKNRPSEFSIFLRPTLKNYNSFVHSLDKMLSDNLNKEFFKGDVPLEEETERKDGKIIVSNKGTISLLEEWITKYFTPRDSGPLDQMFKVFKRVRKERQKPAHAIQENVFDKKYFKMQDELIKDAYGAIRTLRLILSNHPCVDGYKVPRWLFEGNIKLY